MNSSGRPFRFGPLFLLAIVVALLAGIGSCRHRQAAVRARTEAASRAARGEVLVTGYCNCGKCCGWRRSWLLFGSPVYNYGPAKGKPKKIGVTARGTKATHGTIAADPKVYPFGTHLFVPGYGPGTVEDVGGSIRGKHIDIWFPSHEQARRWGSRWLKVREIK